MSDDDRATAPGATPPPPSPSAATTSPPDSEAEKVGYCSPPRASRWKPGQSGNPRGRRRGARGYKSDRDEVLDLPVRGNEDGKARTLTTQQAVLRALRAKAIKGEIRAIDRLIDMAQERQVEIEVHDHASRAQQVCNDDRAALRRAFARLAPPADPEKLP